MNIVFLQIFSRYGKVLRIITFSKNSKIDFAYFYFIYLIYLPFKDSFQALIQLSESSAALNASQQNIPILLEN
jgi:hypothetical protein